MIVALLLMAIELPQLGTVGDLPPADNRAVLAIDRTGAMKLDGKELDYQALLKRLPSYKKGTNFLLRVDRRVPVRAIEWIQHAFAIAKHDRMFFAVLPVKSEEVGAFALFIPRDVRVTRSPGGGSARVLRLRTLIVASKASTKLASFAAELGARIQGSEAQEDVARVLPLRIAACAMGPISSGFGGGFAIGSPASFH